MTSRSFEIPEPLRLRVDATGNTAWLDGLAQRVAELESRWKIRTERTLTGGSESLVLTAVCSDGTSAVVKLGLPGTSDLVYEGKVLQLAAGRGYVALLMHDAELNALLLERLGGPLADLGLPVRRQIEIICATLREAWRPISNETELTTGAQKARWLAQFIDATWRALDTPCDRATIDRALAFAKSREEAFDPRRCVLVHGDAHAYNALTLPQLAPDVRCKLVDPDGLFAEPAYDLAIPMRDWSRELLDGDTIRLSRARCQLLAELTGCDPAAIWEWGFVERVSTSLLLLQIGMAQEGAEMLAVADRLALAPT